MSSSVQNDKTALRAQAFHLVDRLNLCSENELGKMKVAKVFEMIQESTSQATGLSGTSDYCQRFRALGGRLTLMNPQTTATLFNWLLIKIGDDKALIELFNHMEPTYLRRVQEVNGDLAHKTTQQAVKKTKYGKHQKKKEKLSQKTSKNLTWLSDDQVSKLPKKLRDNSIPIKDPQAQQQSISHVANTVREKDHEEWCKLYLQHEQKLRQEITVQRIQIEKWKSEITRIKAYQRELKKCKDLQSSKVVIRASIAFYDFLMLNLENRKKERYAIEPTPGYEVKHKEQLQLLLDGSGCLDFKKSKVRQVLQDIITNITGKVVESEQMIAFYNIDESRHDPVDTFKKEFQRHQEKFQEQYQTLRSRINTIRSSLVSKVEFQSRLKEMALDENAKTLKELKAKLEKELDLVYEMHELATKIKPKINGSYQQRCNLYLHGSWLRNRVSLVSYRILQWSLKHQSELKTKIADAIDFRNLRPLYVIDGQRIKPTELEQSLTEVMKRSKDTESNEGIIQKLSWQVSEVEKALKTLGVVTSEEDDLEGYSEEYQIVMKISPFGVRVNDLKKAPFNFKTVYYDEFRRVDWKQFAKAMIEAGVTYEAIKTVKSKDDFIRWYAENIARTRH